MDNVIFANAVLLKYFFYIKSIISWPNNKNQITILKADSKRVVTGIPLHESGLYQKIPRENYWQLIRSIKNQTKLY